MICDFCKHKGSDVRDRYCYGLKYSCLCDVCYENIRVDFYVSAGFRKKLWAQAVSAGVIHFDESGKVIP